MVLAGHVALALENARLHAETESQAFEIERAFDRLVVAERVATMARLSQGLGHEIANPACAVLASLDVAQIALDAGKTREAMDAIRHAQVGTNAVLDVCQALRPLAGGRSKREELVDLRRVVDGALLLATYELRPKAQVRTEIPRELPYLVADPAKLGQVFLNLLLNAAQAIESGAPERNAVTVRLEAKNGEIVCQVEDTGRGVAPEVGPKLFDTNVTTKVNAEGHGMGLAICKWIVEEAGGTIRWVPNRDRGTVFEVRLPFRKDRV
jgi:C4-dicarboxylate-specific signal transduction histidine kinase